MWVKKASFLRLLLDSSLVTEEKVNDTFMAHDKETTTNGNYNSAHDAYPINKLVENVLSEHSEDIKAIENNLMKYSSCLIIKSENKIIDLLQKINLYQMKKLQTKMKYLEEYEKFLLHKDHSMKLQENELLVQEYLRKRAIMK